MIKGVIVKKIKKYSDKRGWLAEIYRHDEIDCLPAMSYISETYPGVVRGPHEHVYQTDVFVFLGPGEFELYLWDNRKTSPTYKEKVKIKLGKNNPATVVVPPGVVHGYKCVSQVPGWCINLPDKLYAGLGKNNQVDEIRWEEDPASPFKIL